MEMELRDVRCPKKVQGTRYSTSGDIVVTRISLPLTAESRSASIFAVGGQSSLPRINKGQLRVLANLALGPRVAVGGK